MFAPVQPFTAFFGNQPNNPVSLTIPILEKRVHDLTLALTEVQLENSTLRKKLASSLKEVQLEDGMN